MSNPNIIPGPGRPKGGQNKTTLEVKKAIEFVFVGLGGKMAFLRWGREHPSIFYEHIFTKLVKNFEVGNDDSGVFTIKIEK